MFIPTKAFIKIVLRLSRLDSEDPSGTKRRHFEISIDSPLHVLSCLATQAHTSLPEYSDSCASAPRQTFACGCPNAAATKNISPASSTGSVPALESFIDHPHGLDGSVSTGLAFPAPAHFPTSAAVVRPVQMLRNPSYNPPAFDAEEPPPLLATPPPNYDHLFGTPSQNSLADYFSRLVFLLASIHVILRTFAPVSAFHFFSNSATSDSPMHTPTMTTPTMKKPSPAQRAALAV